MKLLKRLGLVLLILAVCFSIFQYLLLPVFLRHEKVREKLLEAFSRETKGTVKFDSFSLEVFPSLSFRVTRLSYLSQNETEPLSLEADYLKAGLSYLSIFQKQLKLKDLILKNASLAGKTRVFSSQPVDFQLKGLTIDARHIRARDLGSIRARGKIFSEDSRFEVTGSLHLGDLVNFKMEEMLCDVTLKLSRIPLESLLGKRLKTLPLKVIDGRLDGAVRVLKKERASKGDWTGELLFQDVIYADLADPKKSFAKSSQRFSSKGSWDVSTGKISILSSRLEAEGLNGELLGELFLEEKGIREFNVHVGFSEFDFERAVSHYPFLAYWFQGINVTCKGSSEIRFLAAGNFKTFKLHGETILNDASIEADYFKKPKGVPFSLVGDLAVENQVAWSGIWDLRYRELKAKGVLAEYNTESKNLEFNLITNKFQFLTFLEATASNSRTAAWDGNVKMLLNYKGQMGAPDLARIHGVINLEGLSYRFQKFPFKSPAINATLKIEDSEMYSEGCYLDFGDTRANLKLNWKGWENPRIEWSAKGSKISLDGLWNPETELARALSQAKTVLREKLEGRSGLESQKEKAASEPAQPKRTLPPWLANAKAYGEISLGTVTMAGVDLTHTDSVFLLENGKWQILPFELKSSQGDLWASADGELFASTGSHVEFSGRGLKLEDFNFMKHGGTPSLKGELFFHLGSSDGNDGVFSGELLIREGSLTNFSPARALGAGKSSPDLTFSTLGTEVSLRYDETSFKNIAIDSDQGLIAGQLKWYRDGSLEGQGKALFSREISLERDKNLTRDEVFEASFALKGKATDLKLTMDSISIQKTSRDVFAASLSKLPDNYRPLEKQSVSGRSYPNKANFLSETVSMEPVKEKKMGFFESLFGRRR